MEPPNPYGAPQVDLPAGAPQLDDAVADLRRLALMQREIVHIGVAYIGWVLVEILRWSMPELPVGVLATPIALTVLVAGLIFVSRLAARLHGRGFAVVCAVVFLIPLLGLGVLLLLDLAAIARLRAAGYRSGLLGTDLRQFR